MKITSLGAVISLIVILFAGSATAATFDVSTASNKTVRNTVVSGFSGSENLLHGETGLYSGSLLTVFEADNDGYQSIPFSWDITVQSGGESVTESGSFSMETYNKTSGSNVLGAVARLHLQSDLIFNFSFGQFAFLSGRLGETDCFSCSLHESDEVVFNISATYTEISTVPLPMGLPLFAGGLGLIFLLSKNRKLGSTVLEA